MKTLIFINKCLADIIIILVGFSLIFNINCSGPRIETMEINPMELEKYPPSETIPFLKLHMKNSNLYLLENWTGNSKNDSLSGEGKLFNPNRELISEGKYDISLNQVVLAETNQIRGETGTGILAVLTVITGVFTIICIANPKACFGSCPTFYASNGDEYIVQSEGFSSSIAPSLEEKDIDALYRIKPESSHFEVQLRNEAYETHVIRSANILALKKPKGGRVFSSPDGEFFQATNLVEASEVIAPEGDISEKICLFDGIERFSAADSTDLASKEVIDFTFNNITSDKSGLVIASRQTLLTTYLFYQGLAYMGSSAGEWIAKLERSGENIKKIVTHPGNSLGRIEVLVKKKSGDWEKINEVGETGPIATDINIVPLKNNSQDSDSISVRLRMTKGMWRIDYVALAELGNQVKPVTIPPSASFPKTVNNSRVTDLLTYPDSVLVTFPGDRIFLNYELPDNYSDYELFMESQGYYLEWMRNEWLAEENPSKVLQMFFNTNQFFKDLAPQFKQVEAEMEESFWSSKYVYQ